MAVVVRRRRLPALRDLGATRLEVRHVFLTHSHRDHIGAWRSVRHARFHLAAITTLSSDTVFTIGHDTLRAYLVSGHTAGTAVYLFRGVLFLGDAVTYSRFGGFAVAKRGFSDNRRAAADNLESLWARLTNGRNSICVHRPRSLRAVRATQA